MKIRLEDNGDGTFTLLEAVEYLDPNTGQVIVAPAGFATDMASVPPALQSLASKVGRHDRAAIVHDWLYHSKGLPCSNAPESERFSRAECDRIFREIMAADGVGVCLRWRMWLGVRLGGWVPWEFPELVLIAALLLFGGCAPLPQLPEGSYLENRVSCSQEDGCEGKAIVHIPLR